VLSSHSHCLSRRSRIVVLSEHSFNRGSRKKSGCYRSGEYGGWCKAVTVCSARYFLTIRDRRALTLSCRRNLLFCTNFPGRFLVTAALRRRRILAFIPCFAVCTSGINSWWRRPWASLSRSGDCQCRLTVYFFKHLQCLWRRLYSKTQNFVLACCSAADIFRCNKPAARSYKQLTMTAMLKKIELALKSRHKCYQPLTPKYPARIYLLKINND
jgi:hypothetical protein